MSEPCFTAAQIAAALGRTRQAVAQRLAAIPADSAVICQGQETAAWHYQSLPPALAADLDALAKRQHYRDAVHLLASPDEQWQPPVPLAQAQPAAVAKAIKLRAALALPLQHAGDPAMTAALRATAGIAEYKKAFGHGISPRTWWNLFDRTINRDRGQHNWTRVDLYLDHTISQAAPRHASPFSHAVLSDTVKQFEHQDQPTANDKAFYFHAAFAHFEELLTEHPGKRTQRLIKNSLLDWTFKAVPTLAKNAKSLRRSFEIKLKAWQAGGRALETIQDNRPLASGNFSPFDFTADKNKIRDTAILHGGSISLAHRKLREDGHLSEEFVNHYKFDQRQNKSYVPASVRAAITPEVEMCAPLHRGPWQAKMRGPYIMRDWSAVQPADWISGDDVTWNSYWYRYDDAGQLHVERGECLVLHDLRTGYILDYLLIAGKYNSRHIRKLITRVHDRHGLPHVGFYFERGVWKARIIRDLDSRENVRWRETENGLAQFNLQVRHATTPRAKTIEGLFHILQDTQRNEPGFVGFNERIEDMERMQDYLARVRRGTAKPEEKLLSMDQWTKRLDDTLSQFNQSVQNGKMLNGQSPTEAWQAGLQRRPLRQLPEDARYLLATHCQRVKIHQHGIVLTIGKNKMLFANPQTGQRIGQEVLAYYNLDCPELLTVSDLDRQNYFTVKNISLPAMSATKAQFSEVHTAMAGHRQAAREIYGNIQRPSAHTISRDDDVSEDAKELGRFVTAETEQHQQDQKARAGKSRAMHRKAAAAGLVLTQPVRDLDDASEAIDRLAALRARAREAQTQEDAP